MHTQGIRGLRAGVFTAVRIALAACTQKFKSTTTMGNRASTGPFLSTFERYVFVELYALPIRLAQVLGFNNATAVEDLRT